MPASYNLVIIPRPGEHYCEDFRAIEQRIAKLAPSIRVTRLHDERPADGFAESLDDLPTLIICFRHQPPADFTRGRLLHSRFMPKPQQLRRFAAKGIRIPRSRLFQFGLELDPSDWGAHLVLKPISPGTMSHGVGTHLVPTALLPKLRPEHFAENHPIHRSRMLVQSYVDSGPFPTSYRVLTLLGEPLYAMSIRLKERLISLDAPARELLRAKVASNAGPRDRDLIDDQQILRFAKRMAAALPEIPLHACDIVRDVKSGQLYALEANPGGNTWHFSSRLAKAMREEMQDGRRLLLEQFGAWDRAAERLAVMTPKLAM